MALVDATIKRFTFVLYCEYKYSSRGFNHGEFQIAKVALATNHSLLGELLEDASHGVPLGGVPLVLRSNQSAEHAGGERRKSGRGGWRERKTGRDGEVCRR